MSITPSFVQCTYNSEQDIHVSKKINHGGVWEQHKMTDMLGAFRYAASHINNKDELSNVVFVDVGANIGAFSLYAAANKVGTVIAFEPLPPNAGIFVASVLSNPGFSKKIKLLLAGAGRERAEMSMFIDKKNRGGSSFSSEKIQRIERIPTTQQQVIHNCSVVTLDSVVRQRVHVMKIDVEGFESCVFAGAQHLFSNFGVVMVFLELWSQLSPCSVNTMEFVGALNMLGYEFYDSFSDFDKGGIKFDAAQLSRKLSNSHVPFIELFLLRRDLLTV
jgi:FkbM family methyltransferase